MDPAAPGRRSAGRVRVRRYRATDWPVLVGLMDAFQGELAAMDDLGRLHRAPSYGEAAARRCLAETRASRGVILLAELDGMPVGFAAGLFRVPTPEDRLSARVGPYGVLAELYVQPAARRRSIARRLLTRLDQHFLRAGRQDVRTEVFAPNRTARRLYQLLGYVERDVLLLRPLTRTDRTDAALDERAAELAASHDSTIHLPDAA